MTQVPRQTGTRYPRRFNSVNGDITGRCWQRVGEAACHAGVEYLSSHRSTLATQYLGFDLDAFAALADLCDRIVRLQHTLSTGARRPQPARKSSSKPR